MRKNEWFYLASIFISSIGNSITFIATGKILYDQLGIVSVFSSILILGHIKSIFSNVLAGWAVDHHTPKKVLVTLNICLFLSSCLFCFTAHLGYLATSLSIGLLIINVTKAFNRNSAFAIVSQLTVPDRVVNVNRGASAAHQSGYFFGLWLGAFLLGKITTPFIILVDGITFLLSGIFIYFVSVNIPENKKCIEIEKTFSFKKVLEDWKFFIRYKKSHPKILHIMIVLSLVLVIIDSYNVFIFQLVAQRFSNDAYYISLFESAFSICVIVVSVCINNEMIKKLFFKTYYLVFSFILFALLIMAYFSNLFIIVSAIILFGISIGYIFPSLISQLQLESQEGMRGKVAASRGIITSILSVPILAIGSFIGDNLSLTGAYIFLSSISAITVIYYYMKVKRPDEINKS